MPFSDRLVNVVTGARLVQQVGRASSRPGWGSSLGDDSMNHERRKDLSKKKRRYLILTCKTREDFMD